MHRVPFNYSATIITDDKEPGGLSSASTHSRSRPSTGKSAHEFAYIHFIDVIVATEKDVNPFVMPPESAIFTLREKERLQAKEVLLHRMLCGWDGHLIIL